jgi:hypothetical protein
MSMVKATTAITAAHNNASDAPSTLEMSQPKVLMSVMTRIPRWLLHRTIHETRLGTAVTWRALTSAFRRALLAARRSASRC